MAEKMFYSRTDVKKELQDGIDGHKVTVVQPSKAMRDEMVKNVDADVSKWMEKAAKKGMDGKGLLSPTRARSPNTPKSGMLRVILAALDQRTSKL